MFIVIGLLCSVPMIFVKILE